MSATGVTGQRKMYRRATGRREQAVLETCGSLQTVVSTMLDVEVSRIDGEGSPMV